MQTESEGSMTQEVLKLALEALETELSIDWTNNDEFNASAEKMYEAIAAIKEALAKEKTLQALHSENERLGLYKDAYAQPEQEPVAWVSEDVCEGQYIDGRPRKIWWECEKGVGTAFYTIPPQRTWVGLTDEEIAQGCKESWVTEQAWQSAVWWAEAKLKEKNSA
jgi:hypothetical protein